MHKARVRWNEREANEVLIRALDQIGLDKTIV